MQSGYRCSFCHSLLPTGWVSQSFFDGHKRSVLSTSVGQDTFHLRQVRVVVLAILTVIDCSSSEDIVCFLSRTNWPGAHKKNPPTALDRRRVFQERGIPISVRRQSFLRPFRHRRPYFESRSANNAGQYRRPVNPPTIATVGCAHCFFGRCF